MDLVPYFLEREPTWSFARGSIEGFLLSKVILISPSSFPFSFRCGPVVDRWWWTGPGHNIIIQYEIDGRRGGALRAARSAIMNARVPYSAIDVESNMMLYFFIVLLLVVSSLQDVSAFPSSTSNTNRSVATETAAKILQRRRQFLSSIIISSSSIIVPTITATQQPANAAIRDPKTGILLPSVGEIESSIPQTWDEDDNPFTSLSDTVSFARLDASDDKIFYAEPRFVEHVDQQAVESMTSYVTDRLLQNGDSVLDLCSSWTSHIAPGKVNLKRVAGLGMNAKELQANTALTEWTVQDLNENKNVKLPYENNAFDVVMCQLSIDYLIHPLQVMNEVSRVLKPGGKVAILISNRLFLTKAVGLWTGSDDIEHAYTVGSYLRYCGGGFGNIKAEDLSTRKKNGKEQMIVGDPLYVITATKS